MGGVYFVSISLGSPELLMKLFAKCPRQSGQKSGPEVSKYRFGVYIPEFIRDIGNSFESSIRRSYGEHEHNTYKNWRAYNPRKYKNYYEKLTRRKRSFLDILTK